MEPGIATVLIYAVLVLFVPIVLLLIYGRLGTLIEIGRRLEARSGESPAPVPETTSRPDTAAPNWNAPTPLAGRIVIAVVLVGGAITVLWLSLR